MRRMTHRTTRWLAVMVIAGMLAVLAMGIWPQLSFREALFYSAMVELYLLFAIASPWYGYRKWNKHSAWVTFATVLNTTGNLAATALVAAER